MRNLNDQLVAVAERADQLALYFSEDKRTFSLHHCFVTLYDFLSVVEKTRKVIEILYMYSAICTHEYNESQKWIFINNFRLLNLLFLFI